MGIDRVGRGMSWGEALTLTTVLAGDPSSQVAAALNGWSHTASRADLTLRDLYDLTHKANTERRNPKPYPRPWDEQPERVGAGTSLTVQQYRAMRESITEEG